MRRAATLVALAGVAAVPVTAATAAGSSATVRTAFSGGRFAFAPKTVTIKRGGTVRFAFADGARHNVTPTGAKRFKAIPDRSSGTVSRRFSRAGTYSYYCTIHGRSMSGRVVVR
jgi:plastocyanin